MDPKTTFRLTLMGIFVTAIAALAAILVIPEVRVWLGLDEAHNVRNEDKIGALELLNDKGEPIDGKVVKATLLREENGAKIFKFPVIYRNSSQYPIGKMDGFYLTSADLVPRGRTPYTLVDGYSFQQPTVINHKPVDQGIAGEYEIRTHFLLHLSEIDDLPAGRKVGIRIFGSGRKVYEGDFRIELVEP